MLNQLRQEKKNRNASVFDASGGISFLWCQEKTMIIFFEDDCCTAALVLETNLRTKNTFAVLQFLVVIQTADICCNRDNLPNEL